MTDKTIHNTIIIGSGPAGLTAAIYAGRANLKPIVFEGNQPGGQLTITTDVENFPGFPNGVMGPEMMDLFRDQAKRFGAECFFKHVTKVDFSSKPYKVYVGDEEKVTIIHRREVFKASKIMLDRVKNNPLIDIMVNKSIDSIIGSQKEGVSSIVLNDTVSGEKTTFDCEGVFYGIGHDPNTNLFDRVIDLDNNGYIITKPDSTLTNIPGVFACGDVQDDHYRQAITAAGSGCMAAIDAEKYLEDIE